MPELPEVETVVKAINKSIKSRQINKFKIINSKLRWTISSYIPSKTKDNYIKTIYRRGKYIIFKLDIGYLIIHLGMTGIIKFINDKDLPYEKHDHFDIEFKDGYILRYNDVRKFGSVHYCKNIDNQFLVKKLGCEPLDDTFDKFYLKRVCQKKEIPIKNLIMNQTIVTGIGNIYACEALFISEIKPHKKSKSLTLVNCEKLVNAIKFVLKKSIRDGGTTLKDFKSLDGKPGYFKQKLLVYGKQLCGCGNEIKILKIGGRSSFYCNKCQK